MSSAPTRPQSTSSELPRSVDSELAAVLEQARLIGLQSNEEHIYSFTSLLLAIYYSKGSSCEWWHSYANKAGIRIEAMLSGLGVLPENIGLPLSPVPNKQQVTTSASGLFDVAREMSRSPKDVTPLGVRHLLGSYIFRMPPNHYKQALSWNFDPEKVAPEFLIFLRAHYPDEITTWEEYAGGRTEQSSSSAGAPNPQTSAAQSSAVSSAEDNVVLRDSVEANVTPAPQSSPADEPPSRVTTADFKMTGGVSRVLGLASSILSAKTRKVQRLTSRAVFFALVDFGAVAPPQTAAGALHKAIKSSKATLGRYNTLRQAYSPAKIDVHDAPRDVERLPFSRNMGDVINKALEIANATTHTDTMSLRHLTAAFLIVGPGLSGGRLSTALNTLAFDADSFLYRMYVDLGKHLPNEDMGAWETLLFATGPRDVPGYSPDDDEKADDFLKVKDEVEPFAAVIAARDLKPPLSVGLFGDWGSGKSFFMRTLRKRIDEIAAANKQSKVFYSQIVQVFFNAWFYVDNNLWATLVSEIFDKLFEAISGGPKSPEQAKKEVEKELEEAQGLFREAKKELDDARSALKQAQARLQTLIQKRQTKEQTIARSINDLATLVANNDKVKAQLDEVRTKMGLPQTVRSFQALEDQLGQAQTLGRRLSTMVMTIFQPPGVLLRITALVVVFLAPVVVWAIVSRLTASKDFHDLAVLLGSAGSFALTAAAWIARQVKRGSGILSEAESVFAKLQAIRENRIRETTGPQRAALQQLQEREEAARKQVVEIDIKVQTLQRELAEMQPGARMRKFIRERSTSTDYSKHLGLVSLIRKDFKSLSDLIGSREDIPIQRIVLYIDDLDRCPPDRVVEVLEAVHLLLAFPLFVVVVGVDARWVVRSLQKEYRGLLSEAGAAGNRADVATPHDYLEKIFQVPFWIHPMTKDASRALITGLLPVSAPGPAPDRKGSVEDKTNGQGQAKQPEDAWHEEPGNGESPAEKTQPDSSKHTESQEKNADAEAKAQPQSTDPGKLILKDFELEFIQELAPYVGRSPRRVKRFVNIYRLVRASIRPGAETVNFLGTKENPGDHRAALVLLAVLTGAPTLASEMMRTLRDAPSPTSLKKFHEQIATEFAGADADELNAALGALRFFSAKAKERTLQRLQKWEPTMARYSFRPRESSALAARNEPPERISKMKAESPPEET